MAVTFDSSASATTKLAGTAATGTVTATHTVSSIAANLYAIAAVCWSGGVNPSDAEFSVTFGGQTMTPVEDGTQLWDNSEGITLLYYLENPPTGPQTVEASFAGMPTSSTAQYLSLATATYSGTAGISAATTAAGAGTDAEVIVPAATGEMVVAGFTATSSVPMGPLADFNQTSRYNLGWVDYSNDPLLIGDAPGADTVTFTADDTTAASWAGAGIELMGSDVAYDATGAGGNAGSGTVSGGATAHWSHTFGEDADAAVAFITALSTNPALTLTAEIGDTVMTELASVINFYSWDARYNLSYLPYYVHFFAFGLLRPPTAEQTVTVTADTASFMAGNSVSYAGVSAFGNVVTAAAPIATLSVPSNVPADRVVAAYGVSPMLNTFGYNQVKRAVAASGADQLLLLGDGPGARGDVVSTATMSSANGNWGAVGVNLSPAPVMLNVSGLIGPILGSVQLADYRVHMPSPLRTYMVPTTTGVVTSYGVLGPEWTQAADAVLDYTMDFTNWLAETGDSIASAKFTPVSPGLTVVSVNVTATQATGWLTGGVTGDVYPVIVHIVTEYGRQYDQTFNLIIQQT